MLTSTHAVISGTFGSVNVSKNAAAFHTLFDNALATEPSRRFRYFEATEPSISLFLLFYAHKRPSPLFYIYPTKKPSFNDK